jgi:hypothetical protein
VQTPADPHRVAIATVRSSLTAPLAAVAATLTMAAATTEAPTTEPTGGRRRRQSRRSRPREQPRLWSLTGRPPKD